MKQNKGLLAAIIVIVLVIAAVVILGGKSKNATSTSSKSSSTSVSNAVATDSVTIQNYAFSPTTIKVKAGTTVTWTNQDAVQHNIIANNASAAAPNGPLIGRGETYKFTFTKAGTYTYYCMPHPYMHGIVEVTN